MDGIFEYMYSEYLIYKRKLSFQTLVLLRTTFFWLGSRLPAYLLAFFSNKLPFLSHLRHFLFPGKTVTTNALQKGKTMYNHHVTRHRTHSNFIMPS